MKEGIFLVAWLSEMGKTEVERCLEKTPRPCCGSYSIVCPEDFIAKMIAYVGLET